jgi:hypothetical protein
MSEAEQSDESEIVRNLMEQGYGDLMNAARSAREQFEEVEIDTDAPKKNELIDQMEDYSFRGSRSDGWTIEVDGEEQEVDLLQVQTPDSVGGGSSSGPSDKTVLYCLTRAETTEERVEQIEEALEENTDFVLREAGNGDKYAIVYPVENQDVEIEEEDEDEEAEEEAEDSESDGESGSSEDEGEEEGEDEEAESEQSEDSDEEDEEEDDEGIISRDVARESLEDKTNDELYNMLVDLDVDGRSNLDTKDEKIEAIMDVKDGIADE